MEGEDLLPEEGGFWSFQIFFHLTQNFLEDGGREVLYHARELLLP